MWPAEPPAAEVPPVEPVPEPPVEELPQPEPPVWPAEPQPEPPVEVQEPLPEPAPPEPPVQFPPVLEIPPDVPVEPPHPEEPPATEPPDAEEKIEVGMMVYGWLAHMKGEIEEVMAELELHMPEWRMQAQAMRDRAEARSASMVRRPGTRRGVR